MTKTLIVLTALVALLMTATAGVIRYELAAPGVSWVFSNIEGVPDGYLFNSVSISHAMLCYLTVMLVGTTMISAARDKGARLATLFLSLSALVSAATALFMLALFAPNFATAVAAYLDGVVANLADTLVHLDFSRPFVLPAAAILYLGLYAMLSTLPRFSWMGVIGALVTATVLIATQPFILDPDFVFAGPFRAPILYALIGPFALETLTSPAILMGLPFLVCAITHLVLERPAWLVLLTLGVIALIALRFVLSFQDIPPFIDSTMFGVALAYIFPLGLAWFALPAVLMFHYATRLPLAAVCVLPIAVAVAMYQWVWPLMQLGLMGQPMRYVDYPNPFADLNASASWGVLTFAVVYTGVLFAAAKGRA